jgi:hypothetical protein
VPTGVDEPSIRGDEEQEATLGRICVLKQIGASQSDDGAPPEGAGAGLSPHSIDLRGTVGFRVTDCDDHLVGKVESPMYGRAPDRPDAVSVRLGRFSLKRYVVPAESVREIDSATGVMRLLVERREILSFL